MSYDKPHFSTARSKFKTIGFSKQWHQVFKNCLNMYYLKNIFQSARGQAPLAGEHMPLIAMSNTGQTSASTSHQKRANLACIAISTFLIILAVIFFCQSKYFILIVKSLHGTPSISSLCDKYFNQRAQLNSFPLNVSRHQLIHYILRDSENSPNFIVLSNVSKSQHDPNGGSKFRKCSHYSCFDIYRCDTTNYNPYELFKSTNHKKRERIKVYIYPNYRFVSDTTEEPLYMPMSIEFTRILHAIATSPYYTPNPEEACLFIVNLDLLNSNTVDLSMVESILWSLPHFAQSSGSNHLLFSMLFSGSNIESHFDIDIGNAMVAAGGYDLSRYRSQFDITIPVCSIFSQLYQDKKLQLVHFDLDAITSLSRKWTLICTQTNFVPIETRYLLKRLESIYSNKMLLLQFDCSTSTMQNPSIITEGNANKLFAHLLPNSTAAHLYKHTKVCNHDRNIYTQYIDMLHNAQFCLILRTTPLALPLLSDALMTGCIPVILADNLVLPFEERIDWSSVAIRIWQHSTNQLFDILNGVSPGRREQLRINGLHIWKHYFAQVESVALTTLDIINERVFSLPRPVYYTTHRQLHQLTPFSLDFYSHGYNYITPKQTYLQSNGFTTVILSYNRLESLFEVMLSVSRAPSCVKIIVVWNNQNMKPPSTSRWPSLAIPIQVVLSESNKLSNRFYPYASIETEAIFAIDDDITMLNADEIEFAYQTWREFPDRIVGFPSRLHHWGNITNSWM